MMEHQEREGREQSRRDFVEKMAWVAPIVVSLAATPSWARTGSGTGSGPDPEPTPRPGAP
jgi:hypothetical protein